VKSNVEQNIENEVLVTSATEVSLNRSVIQVSGKVTKRPDKEVNKAIKTGNIEVLVSELKVLSYCRNDMPFIIRDYYKANEKIRLQYRYNDLRYEQLHYNLRIRSNVFYISST
jgi:aspartyl-tRNA synthetase